MIPLATSYLPSLITRVSEPIFSIRTNLQGQPSGHGVRNRATAFLSSAGTFFKPNMKTVHDVSPWGLSDTETETIATVVNQGLSPLQWGLLIGGGSLLLLGGLGLALWRQSRAEQDVVVVQEPAAQSEMSDTSDTPDTSDAPDAPDTSDTFGASDTSAPSDAVVFGPDSPFDAVPAEALETHRALQAVRQQDQELMADQAWRERGVKSVLALHGLLSDLDNNIQDPDIAGHIESLLEALPYMIETGAQKRAVQWALKMILSLLSAYSPRDVMQISRRGYALTQVENTYQQLFHDDKDVFEAKEWFFFPVLHFAEELQTRICNLITVENRERWQEDFRPYVKPDFVAQFNALLFMTGNDVVDRMEDLKSAEAKLLDLQTTLEDVQNDLQKRSLSDDDLAKRVQANLGIVKMMQAYLYRCLIQKPLA